MSRNMANYMASIGLDTTEIIKSYFKAYVEFDNIDYFIIAHLLTKMCFENEEEQLDKLINVGD